VPVGVSLPLLRQDISPSFSGTLFNIRIIIGWFAPHPKIEKSKCATLDTYILKGENRCGFWLPKNKHLFYSIFFDGLTEKEIKN